MSYRLGILDEWIAIDIDQAGMLCVEDYRDRKEEKRLNELIIGTSTKVLRAFAGDEPGEENQSGHGGSIDFNDLDVV